MSEIDYSQVTKVKFEDGTIGRVIDVYNHKFGVDLRVQIPFQEVWVSSDDVEVVEQMRKAQ